MHKKRIKRLLSLLLLASALLVSCGSEPAASETSDTEAPATEEVKEAEKIKIVSGEKCLFTIIYDEDATDRQKTLMRSFRDNVGYALGGMTVNIGSDFLATGKTHSATSTELLYGENNYDETAAVLADLGYLDYAVAIRGNKIVVVSQDEDGLVKAGNAFTKLLRENTYTDENGDTWLSFEDIVVRNDYPLSSLKILGTDISQYKIVYKNKYYYMEEGALAVRNVIAEATGKLLEVVTDKTDETEYEILVGNTSRLTLTPDASEYSVSISGKKLVFNVAGAKAASAAADRLYSEKFKSGGDVNLDADLSLEGQWNTDKAQELTEGADVRIMSYNLLCEQWGGTDTAPRAEIAFDIISKYKPDAVGIQEADGIWRKYIAIFGGNYKLAGSASDTVTNNYSSILYDSDKYELSSSAVSAYGTTDNVYCRNICWALLKNKATGKQFILVSTHWDLTETGRMAQAAELAVKVNELHEDFGVPVFTTGDYNCSQTSSPLALYRSKNNMWCSWYDAGKYYNRYGSCASLGTMSFEGGTCIDYVFSTKSDTEMLAAMTVINCQSQNVSDHRPVIADIKFTQ